jgi:large conductance mechanosensitive channel
MASNGGFWSDFSKFLMQGNVVDLAVAVIIGGAFGNIVKSFTDDIITPAILQPAMKAVGAENLEGLSWNGILYGKFLSAIINFVIIAFAIFLVIRAIEHAKKRFARQQAIAEAEAPDPEAVLRERMANTLDRIADVLEHR